MDLKMKFGSNKDPFEQIATGIGPKSGVEKEIIYAPGGWKKRLIQAIAVIGSLIFLYIIWKIFLS